MQVRFCDEFECGFGWITGEPAWLRRASHALAVDGRVWLTDPLDGEGVEERVRALGEPAGVIQLIDRHNRDSELVAERLGVPLHRVPFGGVPGSPFVTLGVLRLPAWREVALWWPERRVLVCADALSTLRPYRAPGEMLAVHPFLRLTPPRKLARLAPEHVLVGHGEGIHGNDAADALERALAGSRRRLPSLIVKAARYHLPGPLRSRPSPE